MRRRLVLFLVLIVGGGAATAGAIAAMFRATGSTTTLADQKQLSTYQLAADARGAATVMWTTEKFVGSHNQVAAAIEVRQQNDQGSWDAPSQIGEITQINEARLVVSASGAATVVWYYVQAGEHRRTVLMAATRSSAGGDWSAPRMIWSVANADGLNMTVSTDAAGTATVAWASYQETNPAIWVTEVDATGAMSGRPARVIAAGAGGITPTLAENASGAALLSWQRQLSPTGRHNTKAPERSAEMAVERRSATGRWSAAQRLGRFSFPREPASTNIWGPATTASVVTANGTAAVGWRAGGAESSVPLQVSTRAPASSHWTAPHTLTGDLGGFSLAAAAHNTVVAVWSADTSDERSLFTSTTADAEHWATPAPLARIHGGTNGPILASAANGVVALTPLTGNHAPIQYATRSPAGHWSALTRVGTGDNPEVAVTPDGATTVVWENFNQQGQYKLETKTQQH